MEENDAVAIGGTIVFAILAFWSGLWWLGLFFVGLLAVLLFALVGRDRRVA